MILFKIRLYCLICFSFSNEGNRWAILVAGSNGFADYRHQSDTCRIYQMLHSNGIPDERIIVFMYDDLAEHELNPKKGKIFFDEEGTDVYEGVPKDYVGKEVNSENFLKVLKGETPIEGRKTLNSTENDRIFLFYSDHGARDLLYFPNYGELHAKDLIDTFEEMKERKLYSQMVFYVEACEAGSLFDKYLNPDLNIYVVTASGVSESSWACTFSWDLGTYINDCWTKFFVNDTQNAMNSRMMEIRTFDEQFETVKTLSKKSHECRYGDLSISNRTLNYFFGGKLIKDGRSNKKSFAEFLNTQKDAVRSHDIHLKSLEQKYLKENNKSKKYKLKKELEEYILYRRKIDYEWNEFSEQLNLKKKDLNDDPCHETDGERINIKNFTNCYKESIKFAKETLGNFNSYSRKYVSHLHTACEKKIPLQRIKNVLLKIKY